MNKKLKPFIYILNLIVIVFLTSCADSSNNTQEKSVVNTSPNNTEEPPAIPIPVTNTEEPPAIPIPVITELRNDLILIFTKDILETTDTFVQRASNELYSNKIYSVTTTAESISFFHIAYDADTEIATVNFSINCRQGDQGQKCSPDNAIGFDSDTTVYRESSLSFTTTHLFIVQNPENIFSEGLIFHVPLALAENLLSNSKMVIEFSLDQTIPISNAANIFTPYLSYGITSMSGWRYSYSYPSIYGIVNEISFISKTTNEVIAEIKI